MDEVLKNIFYLIKSGQGYLCNMEFKKLSLGSQEDSKIFMNLYLDLCIKEQDLSPLLLDQFDKIPFFDGFDVALEVSFYITDHVDQIYSDGLAYRIMDWVGSFRNKEIANLFELIYKKHGSSPLSKYLNIGINQYLYWDYPWSAEEQDKQKVLDVLSKLKTKGSE